VSSQFRFHFIFSQTSNLKFTDFSKLHNLFFLGQKHCTLPYIEVLLKYEQHIIHEQHIEHEQVILSNFNTNMTALSNKQTAFV